MHWLRRSFVAGFFVTVPLFISVAALIWLFNVVDGTTTPLYDRVIGRRIPGLGIASTVIVIVLVGTIARNVIGLDASLINREYIDPTADRIQLDLPLDHACPWADPVIGTGGGTGSGAAPAVAPRSADR